MALLPDYDNQDEFHFDELPTTSAGVEQAMAAPVATTPILPAKAVQAPAQTEVDPYEANVRKREANLENAYQAFVSDKDPAKLMSTAPEWFKGGAPPKHNSWAEPLVDMAGGMLTGPKEVAMANPLRPMGLKMQDARQLGAAKGLQALLSSQINKPEAEFGRNLDAAAKEASMMKAVPGGSRTAKGLDAAKTLYEGSLREKGMEDLSKLRKHNMSIQDMQNSTDEFAVPQLAAARRALIDVYHNRGMAIPDMSGTSLSSIQKQLSLFNSDINAESRASAADAKAQNERGAIAARANEQRTSEAARMKNEAAEARAQMDLGDDYVAVSPVTKDPATRDEIREAATVRDTMREDLMRMKEIQHELNAMGRGFTGPWNQWIAGLEGTPEGDKAQALKLEADAIQHDLMTQERSKARGNMGVPQQFELQLTRNLFPAAGDPMAWVKGNHAWDAMLSTIDRTTRNYLRKRGWGLKSKGDTEGAAFEPNVQTSPVAPVVSARSGRGAIAPAGGDDLTLPPQVEAGVQAREAGPLPKVNEVIGKPAPKATQNAKTSAPAAPAPAQVDPAKAKIQAVVKQIEAAVAAGKQLTAEQAARLDALRKQAQ